MWGVSNRSAANSGGELSVATSSDTTPVAKPFPITPPTAPAEPVMVSANTFSAGASHVLDEVSFKAATAITWGRGIQPPVGSQGFIRLTAPAGTVFSENSQDYLITDGSSSRQSNGVQVGPESFGRNVVDVYMAHSLSIAAGDQVRVGVWGVSNPSAANSGGELSVATSSDTTPVAKPFPITPPTAITGLSATANTFSAGGVSAADTLTFKAATAITWGFGEYNPPSGSQGFIRLTAPAGTVFSENSQDYLITDGSSSRQSNGVQVGPESFGRNVVDVYMAHSLSIAAGDQVQVVAHGVANPTTPNGAGEFSVATSSDITAVRTPFKIKAPGAVSKLGVSMGDPYPGAPNGAYTVDFTAKHALERGWSEISVSAPGGTAFTPSNCDIYVRDETTNESGHCGNLALTNGGATATITTPIAINAGDSVSVDIAPATNTATTGAASLSVTTTTDAAPATTGINILPGANISGVVTFNGSPVAQTPVETCAAGGRPCYTTETDGQGRYTIGAAAGTDSLVGFPPFGGGSSEAFVKVTVVSGAPQTGVNIALNAANPLPAGTSIGGHTGEFAGFWIAAYPYVTHGCPDGLGELQLRGERRRRALGDQDDPAD